MRHPQLQDPPQSLELRRVKKPEEQRIQRLVDLERDHIMHWVANDLLRHCHYYVQGKSHRHTDKKNSDPTPTPVGSDSALRTISGLTMTRKTLYIIPILPLLLLPSSSTPNRPNPPPSTSASRA